MRVGLNKPEILAKTMEHGEYDRMTDSVTEESAGDKRARRGLQKYKSTVRNSKVKSMIT